MGSPGYILEMKLHGVDIDVFFRHIVQTAGIRHSSNLCATTITSLNIPSHPQRRRDTSLAEPGSGWLGWLRVTLIVLRCALLQDMCGARLKTIMSEEGPTTP